MGDSGRIVNAVVDFFFFIDIILIFNTAKFDENMVLEDDRRTIAYNYLKGWFIVDFVAIIPIEWFVPKNGEAINLVRFARIGRVTEKLKLLRMMRLLKLLKPGNFSLVAWMQYMLNIDKDFRWFFIFFCQFLITSHVVACIWIIAAKIDSAVEDTWLSGYDLEQTGQLYLTSLYFTVTTITTVGYGDMSATTHLE